MGDNVYQTLNVVAEQQMRAMIARGEELLQETPRGWRVVYVFSDPPVIQVWGRESNLLVEEEAVL